MRIFKIAHDVQFLQGQGFNSNTLIIIGDKEYLIIDPGLPENAQRIIETINSLGIKNKRGQILLTHMHFDHIGAVYKLQEFARFDIMIHKNERKYLESGDAYHTVALLFGMSEIAPIYITKTVEDNETIGVGNVEIKIIHTPGHTIGSVCVYVPKYKILVSGDTVFSNGSFGRTDLPTGDIENLVESLKKLLTLDIDILCPGHGDILIKNAKEPIELALKYAEELL